MDSVDRDTWGTKTEAARRGRVSLKTIQRHVAANRIETKAVPDPHAPGGQIWLYNLADVDRIASKGQPAVRPAVFAPDRTPTGNGNGVGHALEARTSPDALAVLPASQAAAIAAVVQLVSRQMSRVSIQFLTIAEASAETGLTQAYIKRAIADGTLPAVRDRGWRIRRRDLEGL
jgi:excisionase family DNA binding protein